MIREILTMIPGPTPVHHRILERLAVPTTSHQAPSFVAAYKECLSYFRTILRSESGQPFIFGGGGTLSMEMALVNIIGENEKVLILSQGYFGDRFATLADSFGIEYDLLQSVWGQVITPRQLADHLKDNNYAAVTITHVDTSTGAAAPVAEYCDVLRDRDELVVLDGVCATAGMDERFDEWGVDVLLTAPQKAFGAPPGLALCLFSERAMEKRKSLPRVPAYYADALRWLPIMENPGGYYSTPAVNEIVAFHEATRIILEEGLDQRFDRHRRIAAAIRAGLGALGMELYTSPDCYADTLSLVKHLDHVDDAAFRSACAETGVVFAGALGELAGKAFRIGHMGNIGKSEVVAALCAVEHGLKVNNIRITPGTATAAAAPHLDW